MARVFLRLKFRLIRNRLRKAGVWATVAFIGLWAGALLAGAFLGLLSGAVTRVAGGDAAATLYAMAALVWVMGPVTAAALDETLEPRRFELLPLSPRRLVSGLLAASLVGPGSVATTLFALGVVVGVAPGPAALLPALIVMTAFLIWCIASSRWLTTLLTDILRSRRGRDLVVVIVATLSGSVAIAFVFLTNIGGDAESAIGAVGRWVAFTPPGALGRSLTLLAAGEWREALGFMFYGLLAVAVVIAGWQWSLTRLAVKAPRASSTGRARGAQSPLVPSFLRFLPGSVGAAAGKELRYVRRDPRFRSQAVGIAIALAALGLGVGRVLFGTPFAPFLAVIVAWMAATSTGFNQFGLDDRSFWAYVVSGVDLRRVLLGKNLALATLAVPVLAGLTLVAGLLVNDFRHVVSAVLAGCAVLAVWLAVGNVVSVLAPYPLPESNLFGNKNVSGMTFVASIGGVAAAGALSLPVAALVVIPVVFLGWWQGLIGASLALLVGYLLHRASLTVAGGLLESRSLKLLDVLDRPAV